MKIILLRSNTQPNMSFPIRCFTCGKVIGNYWDTYVNKLEKIGCDKALDSMGMRRSCCRRMFLTHNPQILKDLLMYPSEKGGDSKVYLDNTDE